MTIQGLVDWQGGFVVAAHWHAGLGLRYVILDDVVCLHWDLCIGRVAELREVEGGELCVVVQEELVAQVVDPWGRETQGRGSSGLSRTRQTVQHSRLPWSAAASRVGSLLGMGRLSSREAGRRG
jgi:hypothetical protein